MDTGLHFIDDGLFFALIAWIAMCIPAVRELWRSVRWTRVTAKVIGHEPMKGDPDDGILRVEFVLPRKGGTVSTTLVKGDLNSPVGSAIVVAYNPASPPMVTWPRGPLSIAAAICIILSPLWAWLWHAL